MAQLDRRGRAPARLRGHALNTTWRIRELLPRALRADAGSAALFAGQRSARTVVIAHSCTWDMTPPHVPDGTAVVSAAQTRRFADHLSRLSRTLREAWPQAALVLWGCHPAYMPGRSSVTPQSLNRFNRAAAAAAAGECCCWDGFVDAWAHLGSLPPSLSFDGRHWAAAAMLPLLNLVLQPRRRSGSGLEPLPPVRSPADGDAVSVAAPPPVTHV